MTELTAGRRKLVLAICCMSLLIVGMDTSIVNVALPSIRTDLNASVSGLQWTIDSYTVVLASLLILSGSTADRLGRRRIFQTGLAAFTIGSLLCSIAPGLGWLIAFRMVQAVGGSMLNPVAMSIITNVFTNPRERAQAIGVWAGVVGISLGLGPVVGGLLIQLIDWRAIFWVNVPIGVAAFVLAAFFIPESRATRARRVDPVGQVLVIALLASVTYAIIEAPRAGYGSPQIIGFATLAVIAIVGLLRYEPRRMEPLIELHFFSSVPFAGATVIALCGFAAFSGYLFLNTLYLQDVRGYSAFLAGLCTLPMAAMTIIFAPLSGRVVGARGARIPLLVAGVSMTLGAVMLTGLTATTSIWLLLASYVVFSTGFGWLNAPITNTAVSGMPKDQAGVAAAIASTSRQAGATLGVAIIGAVVAAQVHGSIKTELSLASHPAWWIVVAGGVGVLGIGALTTSRWAQGTAAKLLEDSPPSDLSVLA